MDKLWKWVMHLNAKAFCVAATLFFFCVSLWCAWLIMNPYEPLKDGTRGKLPELTQVSPMSTLDFVSNQLAAEALTIPVDPFRPTIEAIFTNETERAAFLKALKAAQNAAAGISSSSGNKKEDPFAHLRKKDTTPGAVTGPDGQAMIIPKLTFMGFFQRPDGKRAAMFYDSANNTTVFYDAGKQIHGVDMVDANVHEAQIRFPDGTTRTLPIGGSVELAAEPDKNPPKKVPVVKPVAGAKPGAALKPGAGAKPGAAKKAAPPQKPAQEKPAQQKAKKPKVPTPNP